MFEQTIDQRVEGIVLRLSKLSQEDKEEEIEAIKQQNNSLYQLILRKLEKLQPTSVFT